MTIDEARRAYREFRRLRARAGLLLVGREQALAAVRRRFTRADPMRAEIARERRHVHVDRYRIRIEEPEASVAILRACVDRLGPLEHRIDLALEARSPDAVEPSWRGEAIGNGLTDLLRELESTAAVAQCVVARLRDEARG